MAANLWNTASVNAFQTTANGSIGAGDTSIILTSVTGLSTTGGVLCLDRVDSTNTATPTKREYISYTAISTLTLTGVTRGLGSSTAQAHNSGTIVEENFSTTHWRDLLTAIQNVLTSAGALDTTKVLDLTTAQTLTTKRITKRVSTTADSATPTPNADTDDMYTVTALAQAAIFGAPTGTPTNGQPLIIRVKDNGTARALSFNAIYRFSSDLSAPTTTVLSKTLYLGFLYNSADVRWDNLAQLSNI